jgi:hypothetical protein
LTAFPVFIVFGARLRPTVHQLVLAASASMLAIGMVLVAQGLIVP